MEEETGLTIEKLRKYKGIVENLSDKEAYEIISGLKTFSQITYRNFALIKDHKKKVIK